MTIADQKARQAEEKSYGKQTQKTNKNYHVFSWIFIFSSRAYNLQKNAAIEKFIRYFPHDADFFEESVLYKSISRIAA